MSNGHRRNRRTAASKPFYEHPRHPIELVLVLVAVCVGIGIPLSWPGAGNVFPQLVISLALVMALALIFGIVAYVIFSLAIAAAVVGIGVFAGIAFWNMAGGIWEAAYVPWFLGTIGGAILGAHLRYVLDKRSRRLGGGGSDDDRARQ